MSVSNVAAVARAPFLLLPLTLVAVGAAAGAADGGFNLGHTLLAWVGLTALHVAVNSFNEASDYLRGIDLDTQPTPFSGGSGTLPAGKLGPGAAIALAVCGALVGLAVGVYFLLAIGWQLLPLMLVGALAVLAYSDVLARSYTGELFAGLGLGALPVIGTAWVQTGELGPTGIAASVPAFCMTFNLLLLNEFPDERADRKGGRRNLLVLLGRRGAARVYAAFALAVPLYLLVASAAGALPGRAALAALASVLVLPPVGWAWSRPETPVPVAYLGANVGWNLLTNVLLALLLAV